MLKLKQKNKMNKKNLDKDQLRNKQYKVKNQLKIFQVINKQKKKMKKKVRKKFKLNALCVNHGKVLVGYVQSKKFKVKF